jgi:acetyl-CoA acetyltransferase
MADSVWEHRCAVAVAGVGYSALERTASRSMGAYAIEAARAAVDDCGLALADVDGFATYPAAPYAGGGAVDGVDVVGVDHLLGHPAIGPARWYAQVERGLVVSAFVEAVHALLAGACRYALVWRAMGLPAGRYGRTGATEGGGPDQFALPYGLAGVLPWHALAYRRYLELSGRRREDMATIPVAFRANAARSEHAVFRDRPLSAEEYRDAPMIADPLCRYDCDVPVWGCVALVLTTAERAADLRQPPAYVAAARQQTARRPPVLHYALDDHVAAGRPLADSLWHDAGVSPAEISVAQLYDGFAPSVLYWLEALGLCGRGEALAWVAELFAGAVDGPALNTAGGSLSEGRLHGMGHLAEAVLQVSGRAQARQIEAADVACALDGSPMLRGGGVVLTRHPIGRGAT